MTNINDAAEIIGRYVHPDFAEEAARDLAAEGHLTPAPQIIRTVKELEALDPETIVQRRPQYPGQYSRTEIAGNLAYAVRRWGTTTHLPTVVVATAAQVRAARKALEEA
ncbi:hypothetical protein [Corynebacterium variabile]|uniref:hypothetical protein n=1 Tax=Corynebacterium variabile TaxID=1727 RepID=UPI0028975436|nr:hypothetical protein [Corynebacterium variabile]